MTNRGTSPRRWSSPTAVPSGCGSTRSGEPGWPRSGRAPPSVPTRRWRSRSRRESPPSCRSRRRAPARSWAASFEDAYRVTVWLAPDDRIVEIETGVVELGPCLSRRLLNRVDDGDLAARVHQSVGLGLLADPAQVLDQRIARLHGAATRRPSARCAGRAAAPRPGCWSQGRSSRTGPDRRRRRCRRPRRARRGGSWKAGRRTPRPPSRCAATRTRWWPAPRSRTGGIRPRTPRGLGAPVASAVVAVVAVPSVVVVAVSPGPPVAPPGVIAVVSAASSASSASFRHAGTRTRIRARIGIHFIAELLGLRGLHVTGQAI